MSKWLGLLCAMLVSVGAYSQTNFYRTLHPQVGSAPFLWSNVNSWEMSVDGVSNWVTADVPPTSASKGIIIQSGDAITMNSTVTIDQTTVDGTLHILTGINAVLNPGAGADLTISTNGILDLQGDAFLNGTGNIVVSGTLSVGHSNANGAIVTGSSGAIRTAARTYNSGAKIIYSTGVVAIGNGHPTTAGVDAYVSTSSQIDMKANVTMGDDLFITSGGLKIASGNLTVNGNITVSAASLAINTTGGLANRTLTAKKDLTLSGGTASITSDVKVATLTLTGSLNLGANNLTITSSATANTVLTIGNAISGDIGGSTGKISTSGPNNNLTINGTGPLSLPFPFTSGSTFEVLTINRTGEVLTFPLANGVSIKSFRLLAGTAITNDNLTLTGDLNLASGTSLTFSGHNLTLQGHFNNLNTGGLLYANATSNLNITGAGAFGTLAFASGSNTLNSIVLNRTGGATVTLNSPLTVNTALTLTDGSFANTSGLTLGMNALLTRNSNSSFTGTGPAGPSYDLTFEGGTMVTGQEASGNVKNITSNATGTVTLGVDITAAAGGKLTVNSGTFTCASKNLTIANIDVKSAGTFTAPSGSATTGLTISTNLNNDGTFNSNNGLVIIAGNVTFTGTNTSNATFFNLTINSTRQLTPGAVLNVQGNFVNDGTFVAGAGRVIFSGSTGSKTVSGTSNTQFYDLVLNKNNVGVSLSFSTAATVTDSLVLTKGQMDITASSLSVSSGATVSRHSAASITTSGPGGGPWNLVYKGSMMTTSLEIPASGNILNLTVNTSSGTVTLGAGQVLNVSGTFNNLTAGRIFTSGANNVSIGTFINTGTFNAPTSAATTGLTITNSFTNTGMFNHNNGVIHIGGPVTIANATLLATNFYTISINPGGNLTPFLGGTLNVEGSFLNSGTFTANTGKVSFNGTVGGQFIGGSNNTSFYDVTLNKSNAGVSLTVNTPQTITHSLTLDNGQLDIISNRLSLSSGSTLTRSNAGLISTTSPGGGPWNLIYKGNTMVSSLEIPTSGSVSSVTDNMNSAQVLTLASDLSVTNDITINAQATGPTITAGAHTISAHSLINGGVFNAPTPTLDLTLTGDLTNNGTFNGGAGTVVFAGSSIISGININFNNFTINPASSATLTASPTLFVGGNFSNSGTFTTGTGTVYFNGVTGSKTIGGTTNTQFYNLTLDKTNAGTSVSLTSPETVTNLLTLNDGILDNATNNLTMATGSGISVNVSGMISGSITGAAPAGSYDLTYTGTSDVAPGLEIQGSIRDYTGNNTGTTTLSANLVISRQLELKAGTLTAITNTIQAASVLLSGGLFIAPSTTLTLTGDFTNNASFSRNSGTVIFNGNSQVLGTNATTFHNITISGTLTGPANLQLDGTFQNDNSFVAGTGKVTFNGGALQNIQGSQKTVFHDIDVTNSAHPISVSVEHDTDLGGILKLSTGSKFDADGTGDNKIFTVLSLNDFPTQDASIAYMPLNADVLGNVTVQRYISARPRDDRFISSSITNATVAQLQNAFYVTGNFAESSYPICTPCDKGDLANLWYYKESANGNFSSGYTQVPVSGGHNTEQLIPTYGYDIFNWDGASATSMNFRGPINQDTLSFPNVSFTNHSKPLADGWNLVGNPYPSEIVWDGGSGWELSANVSPTVWVWDWRVGNWHSYNFSSPGGSDLPGGRIAMGQGFWVTVSAGAVTMKINEHAKSAGGSNYYRTKAPAAGIRVSLRHGEGVDNSFILFDERATEQFDQGLDIPKLELGIERMYIAPIGADKDNLVTYAVNKGFEKDIPLFVYAKVNGEYEIALSSIEDYDGMSNWYIVDKYLHASEPISSEGYRFSVTQNTQTRENRFYLSRHPEMILSAEGEGIQLSCYPNPVSGALNIEINHEVANVLLIDGMGKFLGTVPMTAEYGISKGSVSMYDFPAGIYFVKSVVDGNVLVRKVIKY